jgi:hypothetical protein
MDVLTSAEFRKTYAKLRKPTTVTANGRVIGQWIPEHSATYVMATVGEPLKEEYEAFGLTPPEGAKTRPPQESDPVFRFNSRPFTPVPKK